MRKRFRLSAPTILAAGTAAGPAGPVGADLGTYHESTADIQTNHNASICTLHFLLVTRFIPLAPRKVASGKKKLGIPQQTPPPRPLEYRRERYSLTAHSNTPPRPLKERDPAIYHRNVVERIHERPRWQIWKGEARR